MHVIRRARVEDAGTLLKLAKMVYFINLPADRDVIDAKIAHSRACFLRAGSGGGAARGSGRARAGGVQGLATGGVASDFFMFVVEDRETRTVLGTSQILARMGGPGNPNYSFRLEKRDFFAEDIKTGTSHVVARLHPDETGPTEIGGLILQPAARGASLGKFLSFVRFHFVGLHRKLFSDRVLAEMMAPVTDDGRSLLWEYLGRRFIPLSYTEADRLCQRSREFIAALLPRDDIYLSLLPPEARDVVGRVNDETVPARRMLESMGFEYRGCVDPFDGGPNIEARTDQIPVVRHTRWTELGEAAPASKLRTEGIVSVLQPDGEFYAVRDRFMVDDRHRVCLSGEAMAGLGAAVGMRVGVTDLDAVVSAVTGAGEPKKKRAPRAKARSGRA